MDKVLFTRVIGFIAAPLGIFLGIMYFTNIEEMSFWFMILSMILTFSGLFILYNSFYKQMAYATGIDTSYVNEFLITNDGEKRLERDTKTIEEWNRTAQSKERLRLLKVAASAEES